MEKKRQHFVPASYLNAWNDPETPQHFDPYVWVHSGDGNEKYKKASKNIFKEVDFYTLFGEDGQRNLGVEDCLGSIETVFPQIRQNILNHRKLPENDELDTFCLYAILMLNRSKQVKENVLSAMQQLHDMISALEKHHNAPRMMSLESEWFTKHGHLSTMGVGVDTGMRYLQRMSKALLFGTGSSTFITSDSPCFLYNPHAASLPPFLRSPGFAHRDVELIFPVAPKALFVATWSEFEGTHFVGDSQVDELNRTIRFNCHEFFVTQNGETNPSWFDPKLP